MRVLVIVIVDAELEAEPLLVWPPARELPDWIEAGMDDEGTDKLERVTVRGQTVVSVGMTEVMTEVDEAGQLVTEAGQERMVMVSVEYWVEMNTAGTSSITMT